MYTELVEIAEARGKTVQRITYALLDAQMVVAFSDRTFIAFGIERGYESCDDAVFQQELDLESFGKDQLIKSGIITWEELDQKLEELRETRRRDCEAAERRRYESLKAKFEGGQS